MMLINCLKNRKVRCQAVPESVEGRVVLAVTYIAGTYGMGGPGFFGLRLDKKDDCPEEWLLCTLWNADNWMLVNGRCLAAHPEQQEEFKPLTGSVYKRNDCGGLHATGQTWDEFSPLVLGHKIRRFQCEKHCCELVIGETRLEIVEDPKARPILFGSKKPRQLAWNQDLREAWVLAKTAAVEI
jgi:hypothetical protein